MTDVEVTRLTVPDVMVTDLIVVYCDRWYVTCWLMLLPNGRCYCHVCGIIYRYKCDRLECDDEYIGETARTFGERYKEHLKAPSPIYDHYNISGNNITLNNFSIVGREEHNLSRLIKESMFIRVNGPSLNKNIGKYHLPHIWDEVLTNNIELKLK